MSKIKEKFSSHFANRFKEERKRLKLTQEQVADLCGVSRKIWGQYERSETVPGGEVLFAFAAIGADMNYLMTGERTPEVIKGPSKFHGLRPDQAALLDNYEHCSEEDRDAIKRVAFRMAEAMATESQEKERQKTVNGE